MDESFCKMYPVFLSCLIDEGSVVTGMQSIIDLSRTIAIAYQDQIIAIRLAELFVLRTHASDAHRQDDRIGRDL